MRLIRIRPDGAPWRILRLPNEGTHHRLWQADLNLSGLPRCLMRGRAELAEGVKDRHVHTIFRSIGGSR